LNQAIAEQPSAPDNEYDAEADNLAKEIKKGKYKPSATSTIPLPSPEEL